MSDTAGGARVPGTEHTLEQLQSNQTLARREQARVIGAGAAVAARWLTGRVRAAAARLRHGAAVRTAIAELSALDDRLLRDIGLERHDIPRVVEQLLREHRTARCGAACAPIAELRPRRTAAERRSDERSTPPIAA